jgi:hypothetical protein
VIAEPPLLTGAVNATDACPLPAVADTAVGTPGTVAEAVGVTGLDAAEGVPLPTTFVALTVNVKLVPLLNPVTTIGLPVPDAVAPPGLAVTV